MSQSAQLLHINVHFHLTSLILLDSEDALWANFEDDCSWYTEPGRSQLVQGYNPQNAADSGPDDSCADQVATQQQANHTAIEELADSDEKNVHNDVCAEPYFMFSG